MANVGCYNLKKRNWKGKKGKSTDQCGGNPIIERKAPSVRVGRVARSVVHLGIQPLAVRLRGHINDGYEVGGRLGAAEEAAPFYTRSMIRVCGRREHLCALTKKVEKENRLNKFKFVSFSLQTLYT